MKSVDLRVQADAAGTKEDGSAKIGQGKLQGDIGNLIALIKVFVPMIYGQVCLHSRSDENSTQNCAAHF